MVARIAGHLGLTTSAIVLLLLIYNPRDVQSSEALFSARPGGIVGLLFQLAVFVNGMQARQPAVGHWPWWLRILAVVGVIVFIRIAVTFARNSGRPE